ncbi:MBL fold metallo-hydrolase [Bacteriovorax sp. Seq25_V]|uniref:MBL fold metallo-hydrolase n=1 Tax=Bacteriovorax sp. Seq25_V TaxID=1201288 RepID=UPI000389F972|nr:3',5'-cyclic-nucleotide phosphodiesterase [Bacteriovorax sp. Seq25_V]EQC44315.1 beta-lactamase family protein [Bacteriovorax sp. Seq25_V]
MIVKVIGGHGGVSPGYRATSYLIDNKILIDAGSVASGIPIVEQAQIDHILISHSHLDHISDLAFLADNCFGMKGKPFMIYTNKEVETNVMSHLLNDAIWPDFTKLPSAKEPTLKFNNFEAGQTITLGEYKVTAVAVNHFAGSLGFIIEKDGASIVFTQDTGPTDEIWKVASGVRNLKGIFSEVSFPNSLMQIAIDSRHHTPSTMKEEIKKMPKDVPIFLGHLKPNFQEQLYQEIGSLNEPRITILGSDNSNFVF